MRGSKFPKLRHVGYVLLLLVVFASARIMSRQQNASAAACSAANITVTQVSTPVFYIDTGITPAMDSAYVAYKVDTGSTTSFSDLWVQAGSFSDTTKLNLAPNENGLYRIGATGSSSTKYAYFYLKGSASAVAQNYVLSFYEGRPSSGGVLNCTSNVSNSRVNEIIKASPNKISNVTTTTPYLGGQITMTVTGQTGTMGATNLFTYTPASTSAWQADCFVLRNAALSFTNGNTGTNNNSLYINFANSATTDYVIVYTFDVKCDLSYVTPITPKSDINSGGSNMKHTDTGTASYQAIAAISPTQKSIIVSKSVSPNSVISGTSTPAYTVTLTNSGPSDVTLDSIVDTLPSSPAIVTYISGTSLFNGVAYANPSISGQVLTWNGPFTVPANSSRTMVYAASVPSTTGTYINSALAFLDNIQIDTTINTSDNSPATTKYYVGRPDFSTSTKDVLDINGGTAKPGDTLRFTVTIKNTGNASGTLVEFTDVLDSDIENITNVTTSNCGSTTSTITSTQLNLSNITVTTLNNCIISFDVTIKSPLNENTPISNTAIISGGEQNGTGGSPSAPTVLVDATPNLIVSKIANVVSTTVVHSQVIDYTIGIFNNGDGQGSGISLTDPIDSDVSFNAASLIYTDCGSPNSSYSAPNLSITNITVNAGATCHIQYQATVTLEALHNDLVTNGVDVSAATEGGNNPSVTNAVDLTINAAPNLSTSTKSVSDLNGGVVEPGDTLRYTVWIINTDTGPGSGIPLSDTIDTDTENITNVTFQNCGSPVNNSTSTYLDIVNITAFVDTDCRVTFDVNVKSDALEGAPIENTAYIGQAYEGGATTNPSSTTLYVDTTPVVTISKSDDDADNVVDLLQTITYTLTLTNSGNGPGTTTVTDTITGSVSDIFNVQLTDCGSSFNTTITGKQLSITGVVVGLTNNCAITYQVSVNSDAAGLSTITNTADATTPSEGGSDPSSSSADTLIVHEDPLLAVTKSDDDVDNSVTPGQVITYAVTISNTGNASTVTSLTDTLTEGFGTPYNYTYTNCGTPNSTFTDPEISITNISIAVGSTCEINYSVQIDTPLNEGTTLGNYVDVIRADATKGNDPDPVSADTLIIDATPDLSTSTKVVEDLNGGDVALGDTLRYTITLINSGNGQGTDISITDPIDDDTENLNIVSITDCGPGYDGSTSVTVQILSITVDVGTNCVVVYDVDVKMTALEGADIPNEADVSPALEGGSSTYPSSTTLYVNVTPDISLAKTDDDLDNTVDPSQIIKYTVTLTNAADGLGTTNLTDTVSGPVGNIYNVVLVGCGASYTDTTTGVNLNITGLQVTNGTDCVVTYEVIVNSGALGGETVTNTADASTPSEGGSDPSPASSDTLTVRNIPVLSVTKIEDDSDNTVVPGQVVTYTVTIRNLGNATGNTSFTDTISDYVNAPTNFTYSGCGSASEGYLSPTLTISGIAVTTSDDCIVTYDVQVKSPLYSPLTISNSVDVAASAEGSNDPAPVSADDLNVQVTPVFTSSTKTVSDVNGGAVLPGDTLHYAVTIKNTGDGTATGVTLDDILDTDTDSLANITVASCGGVYADNSTSTELHLVDLIVEVGADCVVEFDVQVKSSALDGTEITNTADIGAATEGGSGYSPSSSPLTVDITPSITLAKTDDDTDNTVDPSQVVKYTITLTNTGDGIGTTNVTDTVTGPVSGIANINITDCGATYTDNTLDNNLVINDVQVSVGTNCVITYEVTVNAGALGGETVTNTADASTPSEGGSDPSPSIADTLTVRDIPVLEVTKSEDDADNIVVPGQAVTYTVTIRNLGNATGSTSFTDTISDYVNAPTNFTYSGCGSASEDYISSTLTVSGITVTTSADCVVTYEVQVKSPLYAPLIISNSVDVAAASEGGSDPSPVSADDLNVQVTPVFTSSTKTVSDVNGAPLLPGDTLHYVITIVNTGDGTATGVSLSDAIDSSTEGITNVSIADCGTSYVDSSTLIAISIDGLEIAVGTNCVIGFDVNVKSDALDGTEINNQATIGAANEGGSGSSPSSDPITVDTTPGISLNKTEDDADNIVDPSQQITYTLTLSNSGDGKGTVNLTDAVTGPASDIYGVTITDCGSSYTNNTSGKSLDISSVEVTPGVNCIVTYSVDVNAGALGGEKINNTADATTPIEGGSDPGPSSASELTVREIPVLGVTKTENDADNTVTPGQTVRYTVTIKNTGNATASTSFTDVISDYVNTPSNFSYNNCGSASASYSSPTLTVSGITVTTANDCVVEYDVQVKSPLSDSVTVSNSVDVAAASEGGNDPSPVPADDLNVVVTPLFSTSTKTVEDLNGEAVAPNDTLRYTITIKNTGNGKATGVTLIDNIDSDTENLTNVTFANCGGVYTDSSTSNKLDIAGLTIEVGTDCMVKFDVTVKSIALDGTEISNTADIGPADEGGSGYSPSSETLTVNIIPVLAVTVSDDDADNNVIRNQVITYTISISNSGNANAPGVNLISQVTGPTGVVSSVNLVNCGPSVLNGSSAQTLSLTGLVIELSNPCVITYTVAVNSDAKYDQKIPMSVDVTASAQGGNDPSSLSADTLTVQAPEIVATISLESAKQVNVTEYLVTYLAKLESTGTLPVQNSQISMPLQALINSGEELSVVKTELVDEFGSPVNLNGNYDGLNDVYLISGNPNTGVGLDARGGNASGIIRVVLRLRVPVGENIPDLNILGAGSDINTISNLVNVILNDTDKDGFTDSTESNIEDRDNDGITDSEDFDPQGVFYCTDNGKIIPGGKIAVTGPGPITVVADGSNGNYQWFANGTPGVYEMTLTAPTGTEIATDLINTGILDPTGNPNPYSLGSNQYQQSGKLANFTKEANPVYLKFDVASGDPWIINNNIPLKNCGALALSSIQEKTTSVITNNPRRSIIVGAVLLAALIVLETIWRRRAMEKPVKPGKRFIVAAGNPRRIIARKHGIDNYIERISGDKITDRTTTSSIHYAGWLKKTAKPGDKGLSIIGGHIYGKRNNGVFLRLNEFEKDDEFEVEFGNGKVRKFIVESVRLVKPADVKRAATFRDKDIEKQVNLITFADRYDKKTRYTQERVLVIGRYKEEDEKQEDQA